MACSILTEILLNDLILDKSMSTPPAPHKRHGGAERSEAHEARRASDKRSATRNGATDAEGGGMHKKSIFATTAIQNQTP